ncbi:MAG TPA: ester cyclase [Solirubrobacteraceae bacterium]|nr:ester cyclase [Solirubrobacteraceae bacterium]
MAVTSSSTAAGDVATSRGKELVEKYVAAWNAHDGEQVLSLLTDDVIYDDASWPTQMRGRAEVRAFLEATWRAVPDLSFELDETVLDPSGIRSAWYWRGTGSNTGRWDPPGLDPTGRRVQFHGAEFAEQRDGKFCRVRVVYDVTELLRQAGVLPKRGSTAERLMMHGANLLGRLRRL